MLQPSPLRFPMLPGFMRLPQPAAIFPPNQMTDHLFRYYQLYHLYQQAALVQQQVSRLLSLQGTISFSA
jgi:hypothetical protein